MSHVDQLTYGSQLQPHVNVPRQVSNVLTEINKVYEMKFMTINTATEDDLQRFNWDESFSSMQAEENSTATQTSID